MLKHLDSYKRFYYAFEDFKQVSEKMQQNLACGKLVERPKLNPVFVS
jgi:hypothetical protein